MVIKEKMAYTNFLRRVCESHVISRKVNKPGTSDDSGFRDRKKISVLRKRKPGGDMRGH